MTTKEEAKAGTDAIQHAYLDYRETKKLLAALIDTAFKQQYHKLLGYPSWKMYCEAEFRVYSLSRDEQAELNSFLQVAGMSARAAADASGTSDKTAATDASNAENSALLTGTGTTADGRQYPRRRTAPEPDEDRCWTRSGEPDARATLLSAVHTYVAMARDGAVPKTKQRIVRAELLEAADQLNSTSEN